jgi:hypothetical protein
VPKDPIVRRHCGLGAAPRVRAGPSDTACGDGRAARSADAVPDGALWIIPVLGKMRLDEIDLAAIDLLKEAMEEKSEKYVNNVLAILSNMVRTAKAMRKIRELPDENFGLFKVDNSKPPPFYAEEEYGRLIEAALKIDLRLAVGVLLGGGRRTPLRRDPRAGAV